MCRNRRESSELRHNIAGHSAPEKHLGSATLSSLSIRPVPCGEAQASLITSRTSEGSGMSDEIETKVEETLARMEDALTSEDNSSHVETCATTLRVMQRKALRMVTDAQQQVKHLMADVPAEDFERVMLPLTRLTFVIGAWDNYVERLIDNGFNFAETPYHTSSRGVTRTGVSR